MSGRAILCVMILATGCSRSVALDFDPEALRIATPPSVDSESVKPSPNMGPSGAPSELFYPPIEDFFVINKRTGSQVVLKPRANQPALKAMVRSIRYDGLVSTDIENGEIIVRFSSEKSAREFELGYGGIALGPYQEGVVRLGERRLLVPRGQSPLAQFVGADWREHWQLLVGGHVDVVPSLTSVTAARLRAFDEIRVLSIETKGHHTLILNPKRTTAEARAGLLGTSGAGAGLPVITAQSDDVEIERQARVLANRTWRRSGKRPVLEFVDPVIFQKRVLAGDFEALLAPMPSDIKATAARLASLGLLSPESKLEDFILQLEPVQSFAAVSADWCGDVEASANSWRWIAELRKCPTTN